MTFWSCREKLLIRNTRLISKFVISQSGQQAITIHMLPNILQSKCKQAIKFGKVIKDNKRNIFLQNSGNLAYNKNKLCKTLDC